ncbi:hypothetical protein K474DRAFT_1670418 [Panus rudis PR-1116 ss-1]|nr:hypothetical protein K474DRAFT_1670418 [Panus rudis PR-1116 ss-1]
MRFTVAFCALAVATVTYSTAFASAIPLHTGSIERRDTANPHPHPDDHLQYIDLGVRDEFEESAALSTRLLKRAPPYPSQNPQYPVQPQPIYPGQPRPATPPSSYLHHSPESKQNSYPTGWARYSADNSKSASQSPYQGTPNPYGQSAQYGYGHQSSGQTPGAYGQSAQYGYGPQSPSQTPQSGQSAGKFVVIPGRGWTPVPADYPAPGIYPAPPPGTPSQSGYQQAYGNSYAAPAHASQPQTQYQYANAQNTYGQQATSYAAAHPGYSSQQVAAAPYQAAPKPKKSSHSRRPTAQTFPPPDLPPSGHKPVVPNVVDVLLERKEAREAKGKGLLGMFRKS